MKAKTIIYLGQNEKLRSPDGMIEVLKALDAIADINGTVMLNRLTDHGTVKHVFLPKPNIVRLEDA